MHVVLADDFDAAPDSSSIWFGTGRQSLDGFSVAYQDAWEAVRPTTRGAPSRAGVLRRADSGLAGLSPG
jgi:hypothetical protein